MVKILYPGCYITKMRLFWILKLLVSELPFFIILQMFASHGLVENLVWISISSSFTIENETSRLPLDDSSTSRDLSFRIRWPKLPVSHSLYIIYLHSNKSNTSTLLICVQRLWSEHGLYIEMRRCLSQLHCSMQW